MSIEKWYLTAKPADRASVAKAAGTSVAYLRHIAHGHRTPSPEKEFQILRAIGAGGRCPLCSAIITANLKRGN